MPVTAHVEITSPRRGARKLALQGVYAWLLTGEPRNKDTNELGKSLSNFDLPSKVDEELFRVLIKGTLGNVVSLRKQFLPFINRPLVELSPIEHSILLIGAYELIHHIEVPYRVAINEAVELAKLFGATDGFKFVNGVLDKLAEKLRSAEAKLIL